MIITPDYLDWALALQASLLDSGFYGETHIFTTTPLKSTALVEALSLDDICETDTLAQDLLDKYRGDLDRLRWVMKSRAINFLIQSGYADSVMYCDPDVHFFKSPKPIFDLLETGGVVLTPHWRPSEPTHRKNFRLNFQDGLFNAGCVAANQSGLDAMDWWARACLAACEKDYPNGLYDDQRYLDLLPIYFPETRVLQDRGFNLADWNVHLRQLNDDGCRAVPDRFDISMVHFTKNTIARIQRGGDEVLRPYYERYLVARGNVFSGRVSAEVLR